MRQFFNLGLYFAATIPTTYSGNQFNEPDELLRVNFMVIIDQPRNWSAKCGIGGKILQTDEMLTYRGG